MDWTSVTKVAVKWIAIAILAICLMYAVFFGGFFFLGYKVFEKATERHGAIVIERVIDVS